MKRVAPIPPLLPETIQIDDTVAPPQSSYFGQMQEEDDIEYEELEDTDSETWHGCECDFCKVIEPDSDSDFE